RALAGTGLLRGFRGRWRSRFVGGLVLGRAILCRRGIPLAVLAALAVGTGRGRVLAGVFGAVLGAFTGVLSAFTGVLGCIRVGPIREIALIVLVALEVGLVPTAAFEPKHR